MDFYLALVVMCALTYVCLLPFVFFKDGTFNLAWLATASPYVSYLGVYILGLTDVIEPWQWPDPAKNILEVAGFGLAIAAIILISLTIASHSVPLALWHQKNDAPESIVQHGPYSKVRHPFYTSFILILAGSFLVFPFWSVVITIYGITALTLTAKKEEIKLSNSEFSEEYKIYMEKTGRFFPSWVLRWRRSNSAGAK